MYIKLKEEFDEFYEQNKHRTVTCDEIQPFWNQWYLYWNSCELTSIKYEKLFNHCHKEFPVQINENVGYRLDNRTLGELALSFVIGAAYERLIVKYLFSNLAQDWWPDYDHHIHKPDGRTYFGNEKRNFTEIDIEVIMKSGDIVNHDIKINWCSDKKGTFKDENVENYLNQNGSMSVFNMDRSKNLISFYYISPQQLEEIAVKCKSVPRHEFGGKKCGRQIHFIDDPNLVEFEHQRSWVNDKGLLCWGLKEARAASEFGIERISCKEDYLQWMKN